MLRLWRDRVAIALCPDRVVLSRISRRWRRSLNATRIVDCEHKANEKAGYACIEILRAALRDPQWADTDAYVTLSSHFVHYALVPWSPHLVLDDEKRSWVKHHFDDLYGEATSELEYRWSDEGPDATCVASAIDGALARGARDAFDGTSLRLRSIQPYVMNAFNHGCSRIANETALLAFPEPGRLCIASVYGGTWRSISSRQIASDWQADLPHALQREIMVADPTPSVVFVYASNIKEQELSDCIGIPVRKVDFDLTGGHRPAAKRADGVAAECAA